MSNSNNEGDDIPGADTHAGSLHSIEQGQNSRLTPVEGTTSERGSSSATITHDLIPIRIVDSAADNSSTSSHETLLPGAIPEDLINMETSFSNPAVDAPDEGSLYQKDSIMAYDESMKEVPDVVDRSLHQLARDGDVNHMRAKLKSLSPSQLRRKLAQRDPDRLTPLHYAARYNHLGMCVLLIETGADVQARGEDEMTPLHLVAKYKKRTKSIFPGQSDSDDEEEEDIEVTKAEKDNIKILKFFVDSGASVNDRDFYGLSPLHQACLRGNKVVAEALLECTGIAIEAMDKQQMTPLHIAAVYGHGGITELLLNNGANIRCKDEENGTPLHLASAEGILEIVELLMAKAKQDFSPDFVASMLKDKDNDGNTAFHLAVNSGHMDITRFLVNKAKELGKRNLLNARRANNETALHLAASNGHLQIVKLLSVNGARNDLQNDDGSTPLILASKFNHFQIVKYLLECGANINAKDSDDYTALLIAANYGHPETITLLIQNGADVTAVDKQERNVLHQCADEERVDAMQKMLQDYKKIRNLMNATDRYGNTPLHAAASQGHFTILKVLLEAKATIDLKNDEEQTPLHLAAIHGRVRVIKELLRHDKSVIHDDDEDANTALHLAALEGRDKCVKELVNAGASIDARNVKQWTPLDCCASKGHARSALVLLESDSPVDPKDKRSITPLHLSCQEGHVDMVKLLLKWNADVSIRSNDGRNALDFATDFAKEDCALAIVESTQWREALQNITRDVATGQFTQTPMRKLIKKMPEVAEAVFRNCLQTNNKLAEHPDFKITFDFEFLDDEYACKHWMDQSDVTSETSITVSSDATYEVYDEHGNVNKDAEPYNEDSSTVLDNHCLMIMVKSKRELLLRHPLVLSLLNYKWRSYGRIVYYTNLILYTLFMAVFNSYMLTVPAPYAINSTATTADGLCVKVVTAAQGTWGTSCTLQHSFWQPVAQWIVVGIGGLSLLKELFQMIAQKWKYFISITNLLELTLYVLCILTVIDFTDYSRNTGIREPWQWQCGAFAIFLSWMGLLLFIQNFPRFGIFVLMFTDVFKTFVSFFGVFLFFIFGFAFSFHALFQNRFAFSYWWNSIIKTMVMMIGEFEYDALFNEEFTSNVYSDQVNYEAVSYVIFVLFLLIMSIIIMNLLVGLAVDDIKEVQDHAELEGLAMQVKLALDVEYTLPHFIRRRLMKRKFAFRPNEYKSENWVMRYLLKDEKLSAESISNALTPEKGDLEEIEDKVENIQGQMQKLREKVRTVNSRTQTVESMLKAIISHLKINYSDDQDDQDS